MNNKLKLLTVRLELTNSLSMNLKQNFKSSDHAEN